MEDYQFRFPQHFWEAMRLSRIAPEERIKCLYQQPEWTNSIDDRLAHKKYVMPTDAEDSLDQLIEWYVNKKSKRVKYAGQRLRKAFPALPPADQRKVGLALLTGAKADTEWVCARLLNYKPAWNKEWQVNWHPCYKKAVEEVWQKYKGKFCGKLLIYFLDPAIVRRHIEELTVDDELYICLCHRFVGKRWFHVDADRLKNCTYINEYLSIMSRTKEGISDEEAETLLYQWIGTVAALFKNWSSWMHQYYQNFWRAHVEEHRTIYSWGIDTALYYLLKMHKISVVMGFLRWDQKVYHAYYSRLCTEHDSPDNLKLFIECIIEKFPESFIRFTRPNTLHFHFAKSPGQPLLKPIQYQWDDFGAPFWPYFSYAKEKEIECYLSEDETTVLMTKPTVVTEAKEGTQADLLRMLNEKPSLQKLVNMFELTIIKDKEDEGHTMADACPF